MLIFNYDANSHRWPAGGVGTAQVGPQTKLMRLRAQLEAGPTNFSGERARAKADARDTDRAGLP